MPMEFAITLLVHARGRLNLADAVRAAAAGAVQSSDQPYTLPNGNRVVPINSMGALRDFLRTGGREP